MNKSRRSTTFIPNPRDPDQLIPESQLSFEENIPEGSSSNGGSTYLSRQTLTPRIEKENTEIQIFGTCSYYVETQGARDVFVAGNRIFYICDDHVYYSSPENPNPSPTFGISRSSNYICQGPDSFYFIHKGKIGKGKDKKYSNVEGIVAPEEITGNDKEVFILDRFGECYQLTKGQKKRFGYSERIVRISVQNELKGTLLESGRIDSNPKFSSKSLFIDIAGIKQLWGLKSNGEVENSSGVVVPHKMLRIYSGFYDIYGEDEEFKVCVLKKEGEGEKLKYYWDVLGPCEGRNMTAGNGFILLGRQPECSKFGSIIIKTRRLVNQIEALNEYYYNPIIAAETIGEKSKSGRRSLKRTGSCAELQPSLNVSLEPIIKELKILIPKLNSLNAVLTRQYSCFYRSDTYGEKLYRFFDDTVLNFIALAQHFASFHEKSPQWYTSLINPWKQYEDKIPAEISKKVFERRSDILSVVFSPLRYISEITTLLKSMKIGLNKGTEEYMWNKKLTEYLEDLLDRMNEETKIGEPLTWSSWFSNEKGRIVINSGTIEEFTNLLQTEIPFDPEMRDVFVNTITLFEPIDGVIQKLIPRKPNDYISKQATKNILITLQKWLMEDPFQFTRVEGTLSRIQSFLKIGKKDANESLKKEVTIMLENARKLKNSPIYEPITQMFTFSSRDFCKGFNDHIYFSDMMTYVHTILFSRITEAEIVQFFTKKPTATPNIKFMTTSFNWLSETLSSMIKDCSMSFQSAFFNFIMKTAERFYEQRNFFGLCAIVFALHKIQDFDYLKSNLSKETQVSIEKFDVLCSFNDNYKALRTEISKSQTPLIPFIGILTKDLLVGDEMYASFIAKSGHFNFNKLRAIHHIAQQYLHYQNQNPSIPTNVPAELFDKIKLIHGINN
ncbi:RasGEF domain containing protein [Entamoeba nuttalli P19]|uniref:RasGEF domain containing protein n=1 Tax=Entamoeba nuttalli (strain P19) TaxID=1076696 RepID=K2HPB9_ENTNP|nr:RasGEF domain containing protein [Entamoeba nuttalli P19]EKE37700.1 RasGEF domain containing protein [Entamoeba nuttalli P19]|eukprot:XP_008859965.1 RasGEF domain containing protein [Entamoeba nuttalli P19]